MGIGCSLALATDLRIASDAARFGVVFSRIGLAPDGGASHLLRELVGTAKALELLFTGDLIDAGEALRLGLVNRVVAADELADATRELAERLAPGADPRPRRRQGCRLREREPARSRAFSTSRPAISGSVSRSDDVKEGIRAFLERRKPEFRGR